jgi:hypothetical protein
MGVTMREMILLTGFALAACAPVAEPPASPPPEAACDADMLQGEIGRIVAPDFVEWARSAAGARTVRVIRPGMAVTMDYRQDRLNLSLDEAEKLVRANCG